jgi:hypothetical protein
LRSPVGLPAVLGLHPTAAQPQPAERWALRPASFAPGFRGLSEGFIDFEALVAAAAGSRNCPQPRPLATGSAARADGLLLSFAQAGYVRAEPAILEPAEPFLDLSGEGRAITPRRMTTAS